MSAPVTTLLYALCWPFVRARINSIFLCRFLTLDTHALICLILNKPLHRLGTRTSSFLCMTLEEITYNVHVERTHQGPCDVLIATNVKGFSNAHMHDSSTIARQTSLIVGLFRSKDQHFTTAFQTNSGISTEPVSDISCGREM